MGNVYLRCDICVLFSSPHLRYTPKETVQTPTSKHYAHLKKYHPRISLTPRLRPHICSAMILAAGRTAQVHGAAISYTTAGGTYSQNFDTLPTTLDSGTALNLSPATGVFELSGTQT